MVDNRVSNKRIARNTAFLYVRMIFVLVVSLYTSRVVLNVLGINDYGVYNVVAGFVSMFGFLNSSLTACVQRFYNYEYGKRREEGMQRVFKVSCYIELFIAIVVLLLLEVFGCWYIENILVVDNERLSAVKILFQFSVFQLIIVMMQVPFSGVIIARERMDYYAFVGILDVVLKLIIVLILPYVPYDKLLLYAYLYTLIYVIDFLLYAIYAKCQFAELNFTGKFDKKLFFSMLSFSGWNVLGAIAMVGRTQGVNMILNLFFGTAINAARGVAVQVQGALFGFVSNIPNAARPQLVESYAQGNVDRSMQLMYTISKICFISLYILVLPVVTNIDDILQIWLGEAIPDFTNTFTILILISLLIDVLNMPITMLIMATGNIKAYCLLTSLAGLLILPFSYVFLLMGYSPNCVFIVGIAVSIIVQLISVFIMKKVAFVDVNFYIRRVILPLVFIVLITIVPPFVIKNIIPNLFLGIIISSAFSVLFTLAVTYFCGLDGGEKDFVKLYIKRFIVKIK